MLNENAKKWVAALRSGEFARGEGKLRSVVDGQDRFCCLGVACELYNRESKYPLNVVLHHIEERTPTTPHDLCRDFYFYNGISGVLPPEVQRWLGLTLSSGQYGAGHTVLANTLAKNNDDGYSFDRLADIIESEPEGLFLTEDEVNAE